MKAFAVVALAACNIPDRFVCSRDAVCTLGPDVGRCGAAAAIAAVPGDDEIVGSADNNNGGGGGAGAILLAGALDMLAATVSPQPIVVAPRT